ncbi:hypothetical protein JZ751_023656 [Albula glossodonta]|uniref:Uncharacterized protein n=1 Tax=Albula glossodonta TaxID=121402 RepID=A0A8T2NHM0_9TELE|nr:hypothetical protein JZ751_023656 [Albula glossodonta]
MDLNMTGLALPLLLLLCFHGYTLAAPAGGPNPRPEDWPLYVYATVGILGLIVTGVMIFCVLRRKGMKRSPGSKQSPAGQQTQNHTRAGRQASVPLNKDEVPLTSHQASQPPDLPDRPRSVRLPQTQPSSPQYECVYDNAPARAPALSPAPAPARRSTRTKRTPAKKAPPPSGGIYDNEREEPDTSIVYAALNHQVARKGPAPAQAHIPMEEFTEYAAIRVS